MAFLTQPQWTPQFGNPVPCATRVQFSVMPGPGVTKVRIRYALQGSLVQFAASPPQPGATPLTQSGQILEDEHPVTALPVARGINLQSAGQGAPAAVSMTVTVFDVVGGAPANPNAASAMISFTVA
jgi:hypothetical protein